MSRVLLSAQGIKKSYIQGKSRLNILKGVDLEVYKGESLCLLGSSGAGKSTLLHILGTLERPDGGSLAFQGKDLLQMGDDEMALFRNRSMGFVFQFHHLLPEFTALENVMMPCRIAKISRYESRSMAADLLALLGLQGREGHYPSEMSGGEQQRVSIARALIRKPEILFADEPTGNLDSENGEIIKDLFFDLQKRLGVSLVVVTHDIKFAEGFDRQKRMVDGSWSEEISGF